MQILCGVPGARRDQSVESRWPIFFWHRSREEWCGFHTVNWCKGVGISVEGDGEHGKGRCESKWLPCLQEPLHYEAFYLKMWNSFLLVKVRSTQNNCEFLCLLTGKQQRCE